MRKEKGDQRHENGINVDKSEKRMNLAVYTVYADVIEKVHTIMRENKGKKVFTGVQIVQHFPSLWDWCEETTP